MRIYLIGFMNSGKTTLGARVAMLNEVTFLDTDAMVEAREGLNVQDIFIKKGELYFRNMEAAVLRDTSLLPKAIIATGGGLPCHADNMDWIMRHGISIYLEWPWEKLKLLLREGMDGRPLLSKWAEDEGMKSIEHLFFKRKPFYEKAAITIEMCDDLQSNILNLEKTCKYIW